MKTFSRSIVLPIVVLLCGASVASAQSAKDAPSFPTEILATLPGGDGRWSSLAPVEPSGRWSHAGIYDPLRNRLIVFGGWIPGPGNDVWVLSLDGNPVWTQLFPAGTPPVPRLECTAIYDAEGDRMVIFGGADNAGGNFLNDAWALTLGDSPEWTELQPSGERPPARVAHTAVYDSMRRRVVVFGGWSPSGRLNDVWALDLDGAPAWAPIGPWSSPARSGHAAIYDPIRDRMIVFGGEINGDPETNETWEFTLGGIPDWRQLFPSGPLPNENISHAAIHDPIGDRMIVFGGFWGGSDPWSLSLGDDLRWTRLVPSGVIPSARENHVLVYDSQQRRMIAHAGWWLGALSDTRALSLAESSAWYEIDTRMAFPEARAGHIAVHDRLRNRMIMFGGDARQDTWALSLGATPGWEELLPIGPPPSGQSDHTAIYDPIRDRVLTFGGDDGANLNELWALNLGDEPSWVQLFPEADPPAKRYGATAIYDPVMDRMILFGGMDIVDWNRIYYSDVWALQIGGSLQWMQLEPTGTPPPARAEHSAIYDPQLHRMVVFGGVTNPWTPVNDTWTLRLEGEGTWESMTPSGTLPSPRGWHTALYDVAMQRMVIHGAGSQAFALSLRGELKWRQLFPSGSPPGSRLDHTAIYDPDRNRMVLFGGAYDDPGAWFLNWSIAIATDEFDAPESVATPSGSSASLSFALAAPFPNPSTTKTGIRFSVPRPTRAILDVLDASGRRVTTLLDRDMPAGSHETAWVGTDDEGSRVARGVYFIRLRTPEATVSRRAILM